MNKLQIFKPSYFSYISAFLFFAGGFESSSTTMSFCLYELSKYPEIQQKVYEEIIEVLEKHNGNFTYEAVADMKFMGHCIDGISMHFVGSK